MTQTTAAVRAARARAFRLLLTLALITLSAASARVEAQKTAVPPASQQAGAPTGTYPLSGFESVNLFNGNLNFNLPLATVGGRGPVQIPITLQTNNVGNWSIWRIGSAGDSQDRTHRVYVLNVYDLVRRPANELTDPEHLIWHGTYVDDLETKTYVQLEAGPTPEPTPTPLGPWHVDGGRLGPTPYSYNPGGLTGRTEYTGGQWNETNHNMSVPGWSLTRLTFTWAGNQYELRDLRTGGRAYNGATWNEVYSRGRVFVSVDGSSATFVSDAEVTEQFDYSSRYGTLHAPSGFLLLADGTRFRVEQGRVSWIRDRHGNLTTLSYDQNYSAPYDYEQRHGPVERLLAVTDSMGRETKFLYKGMADPDTGAVLDHDEIRSKGAGGQPRAVKVWRGALSGLLVGGTTRTVKQLFSAWELEDNDEEHNPADLVSSVELPDGRSYQLRYNEYGELARLTLPTGGKIEYDYLTYGSSIGVYRVVRERRVYRAESDAAPELKQVYKYDLGFLSLDVVVRGGSVGQKVDVEQRDGETDRLLTFESHYFHGNLAVANWGLYTSWLEGKELRTETYDTDGANPTNLLRRVEHTWRPRAYPSWYTGLRDTGPAFDPRLVETTTTLENGLVSRRTAADPQSPDPQNPVVGFDRYNNPTATWEYDFRLPGQPETLLRHTRTTYKGEASYTGGLGDVGTTPDALAIQSLLASPHLRGLPVQQSVYDGAGKERARASFEYDNYTPGPSGDNRHDALRVYTDIYGLCLTLDLAGNCVRTSDASYTTRGNVTAATAYLLDDGGNVTGSVTSNSLYDVAGNVVKAVDARQRPGGGGYETAFDFADNYGSPDGEARANTAPAELSSLSKKSYALPKSVTNAQGHTAYAQYDYHTGQVVNSEDIEGQVTKLEYTDPLSRLTRITPPAGGGQTEYDYVDTAGDLQLKVKKQISENVWDEGVTFFDNLGRTTKTQSQDAAGDVFSETVYDGLGRIRQTCSPYRAGESKHWVTTSYDALGRVEEVISPKIANEPAPAKLKSEYLTATTGAQIGLVHVGVNQAGKRARSITNALGQLVRVDEPNEAGEIGSIDNPTRPTFYKYNALGSLIKVKQGDQSRYFLYDSLGRLIRVRQPEQDTNPDLALSDPLTNNGEWTAGLNYDENGNVKTATDAKGVTVTYEYDALGRLIKRSYAIPQTTDPKRVTLSTSEVAFKYDGLLSPAPGDPTPTPVPFAAGKLTEISNGVSTTQFTEFDNLGRVKASRQIVDGQVYLFGYKYNLAGQMYEEVYPSGRVITNTFDELGDLSSVSSNTANQAPKVYVSDFKYKADGAVEQLKLGNQKWETYKHNAREQVTRIGLGNSPTDTSLWRVDYEYGRLNPDGTLDVTKNDGNLIRQTITVAGAAQPYVQTYGYDPLNRLTEAAETSGGQQTWKQTFGYDRYGNRTEFSHTVGQTPLALNHINHPEVDPLTNRFKAGQGYEYDLNGNLIRDAEGRRFGFDGDNKQGVVKDDYNNVIATYAYDGNGRRVKKTVAATGEVTVFVYDAPGKLAAEYSNVLPPNGGTRYVTADVLNTPRVITDKDGGVIARKDYLPFGEELLAGRGAEQRYGYASGVRQGFTGYEKDEETQLDFAEARYYNPRHGRFTAVDPLLASGRALNPQTFNRYAYAGGNPTLRTDPNGEDWFIGSAPDRMKLTGNGLSKPYEEHFWSSRALGQVGYQRVRDYVNYYNAGANRGWYALDPYEPRMQRFATEGRARAQLEHYKRQAVLNFVMGAAEAVSFAFNVANVSGVERDSEMYAAGARFGTAAQVLSLVTGAGFANAIVSRFGPSGLKIAREALPVFNKVCFVAGTPVHTEEGLKAIEEIKAGDKVLSWNERGKRYEYKAVVRTFARRAERLVRVQVAGETEPIVGTPDHPFYVRVHRARDSLGAEDGGGESDGEWVAAGELRPGDEVLRADGAWAPVMGVEAEERAAAVYNFEVEDNHDYFVGTQGTLVHNNNCELATIAAKAAAKFGIGTCDKCANAIANAFKKAGYSGEIIEVRSNIPGSFIISDLYKGGREAIGDNGFHQGVLVGDMIYDNITPLGVKYADWLKSLDARGGMQAPRRVGSF